ncbi:hypothetical protein D918_09654 [Trichuris suis]|nr:hypothetical protein D918_09654 [Trichuris suis]
MEQKTLWLSMLDGVCETSPENGFGDGCSVGNARAMGTLLVDARAIRETQEGHPQGPSGWPGTTEGGPEPTHCKCNRCPAGLKISPTKCQFLRKEITFLGHLISAAGVSPDKTLTEKVKIYPTPTCLHELHSFLSLAAYYRRFVRGFAGISAPLYRLTQKNVEFVWSRDCADAFSKLKDALTSEPVLRFPDFTKSFILDTDASMLAIGAVLSQLDEKGQEHPVAFGSRILSRAEQKYCVTRREMLAVITFVEQFAPYLQEEIVLRTDHGALQWLQSFKDADGQWARWQYKLQRFRFTVVQRPGRQHANADSLSRVVCKQCGRNDEVPCPTANAANAAEIAAISFSDMNGVKEKQLRDLDIAPFWLAKKSNSKAKLPTRQSKATSLLLANWDRLRLQNEVLWREWYEDDGSIRLQLLVPREMVPQILQQTHSAATAGHLGEEKTLARVSERFYWSGYRSDVKRMRRQSSPRPPSGQPDLQIWSGRRQAGGYPPARMVIGENVCTENAGTELFEHPSGSEPVLPEERPRRATRPPCRFADYIIGMQRHRRHEDMTFPRKG